MSKPLAPNVGDIITCTYHRSDLVFFTNDRRLLSKPNWHVGGLYDLSGEKCELVSGDVNTCSIAFRKVP